MTSPLGTYPLSSPSGEVIPLDVFAPISMATQLVSPSASSSIELPDETELVVLVATVDTIARLGIDMPVPVAGTFYSSGVYLPANIAVSVLLSPGTLYFRSLVDSGSVFAQLCIKWNAIGISQQFARR